MKHWQEKTNKASIRLDTFKEHDDFPEIFDGVCYRSHNFSDNFIINVYQIRQTVYPEVLEYIEMQSYSSYFIPSFL